MLVMTRPAGRDEWLSRKEAARYLESIGCPLSVRAMELRASNGNAGRGPPFTRIGWRRVRYLRSDLEAWAASRVVRIG
jgi:hypothetical protein